MQKKFGALAAVLLGACIAGAPTAEAGLVTHLTAGQILSQIGGSPPLGLIPDSAFSYGSGATAVTGTVMSFASESVVTPGVYFYIYTIMVKTGPGTISGIEFSFGSPGVVDFGGTPTTFWACTTCGIGSVLPTDATFTDGALRFDLTLGPGQSSVRFGAISTAPPLSTTATILTEGGLNERPLVASPAPVPEPATIGLLGVGLLGLGARVYPRRRKPSA